MTWLYIVLAVAVFLLVAVALFAEIIFSVSIVRPKKPGKPPTDARGKWRYQQRQKDAEAFFALQPEDVSIVNKDNLTLRGWYLPAARPTKRFVLLSHGHKCNGVDEFGMMVPFFHTRANVNILLPDHRAHGRSDGKYMGFGALDHKDILEWIDYLIGRFGTDIEILLCGNSMGAATVMLVNSAQPPAQVKCVVEDCGYTNAFDIIANTAKNLVKVPVPFVVKLASGKCKRRAGYRFEQADCLGRMQDAKVPTLFVHGEADDFVPTAMGIALYEKAAMPKELLLVPNAPHVFSYYTDPERYEAHILRLLEQTMTPEGARV